MDGQEAVQEAILEGRDKKLSALLQTMSSAAVAAPIDEEGTTLLHLAANTDNPRVLCVLLDRGVEVNARNGDGFTALHVAAMWGREESVRQLLDRGADPVVCDDEEMTALEYAESEGHSQCVSLLRNWRTQPAKENNPISANSLTSSCCCSTSAQDHHLSHPLPPPADGAPGDQSVAETFVSMFLNMSQVTGDITEVTELSHLTESPSLLEILTPNNLKLSPHTPPHLSPEHSTTPHAEPSDSENTISYCHSPQTPAKSSCVRRLDLAYHPVGGGERREKRDAEKQREQPPYRAGELSLLALDLRDDSSSYNEARSDLDDDELFTTAITEPQSPPSPSSPVSPSPASPTPFLAESLRKIQLRRRQAQETSQHSAVSPRPSTAKHSSSSSSSSLPASTSSSPHRNTDYHLHMPVTSPHSLTPPVSNSPQKKAAKPAESRPYLRQPLAERLSLTPAVKLSSSSGSISPLTTDRRRVPEIENSNNNNPPPSPRQERPVGKKTSHMKSGRVHISQKAGGRVANVADSGKRHGQRDPTSISHSLAQPDTPTTPPSTPPGGDSPNRDSAHHSLVADSSFVSDSHTRIPPRLQKLTNQELRRELLARGEQPGPVTDTTRGAYLVYLARLEAGVQPAGNTGYKGYKYELALVLNGTSPIPDFSSLEHEVFRRFRSSRLPSSLLRTLPSLTSPAFPLPLSFSRTPPTSPRSKRDWSTKTHFNYLLLDSTIFGSLHHSEGEERRESLKEFRRFVEAVFYVGKGKNARSLQHLKDARDRMHLPPTKLSRKFSRILSIWQSGQGVVSLHVFHNTTAEEAFCREACMIDAIGLTLLTNKQKGSVYGDMAGWTAGKRRQFGVFLLHKAFLSFLLDPPQPVGQDDL